ncbi:MAG: hypothetical protein AAF513_17715 [Pseudomonadota bacterium]
MLRPLLGSLLSATIFSACAGTHDPIQGLWQHTDKPALIAFDLARGEASIAQHVDNPEAEGLLLIKAIVRVGKSREWRGSMYAAATDSFVPVRILLRGHTLSVAAVSEEGGTVQVLKLTRPE